MTAKAEAKPKVAEEKPALLVDQALQGLYDPTEREVYEAVYADLQDTPGGPLFWTVVDVRDTSFAHMSKSSRIIFKHGKSATDHTLVYTLESDLETSIQDFVQVQRNSTMMTREALEKQIEHMKATKSPQYQIDKRQEELDNIREQVYAWRHEHLIAFADEKVARDPQAKRRGRVDVCYVRPFHSVEEVTEANRKVIPRPTHPVAGLKQIPNAGSRWKLI